MSKLAVIRAELERTVDRLAEWYVLLAKVEQYSQEVARTGQCTILIAAH
jgi:hypothetical protein